MIPNKYNWRTNLSHSWWGHNDRDGDSNWQGTILQRAYLIDIFNLRELVMSIQHESLWCIYNLYRDQPLVMHNLEPNCQESSLTWLAGCTLNCLCYTFTQVESIEDPHQYQRTCDPHLRCFEGTLTYFLRLFWSTKAIAICLPDKIRIDTSSWPKDLCVSQSFSNACRLQLCMPIVCKTIITQARPQSQLYNWLTWGTSMEQNLGRSTPWSMWPLYVDKNI